MHSGAVPSPFRSALTAVVANEWGNVADHCANPGGNQNHHYQGCREVDHQDVDFYPLRILQSNDEDQRPQDPRYP